MKKYNSELRYQNYPIATLMGNGVTMTRSVMIGFTDPLEAIRTYSYAGTALAAYSPTYDPVYNKTVVAELDNVTTFTYDPARQLIGEVRSGSYPYSTTYLYDSMGNRIQKYDTTGITTNTYNAANQLLLSVPPTGAPTTSSYDNNGNLILQNTGGALTTYTWDQENRLLSLASPSAGLTTYVYSDDGHRQATINGAGTTNFIYDGDIVLQETNASGITQVHYAQGPGTWGLLTAQNRGGTIQYYGPDDRENVRLVLSSAGAALDNNQYKAFLEQLNTPTQTNPFLGGGNVGGRQEVLNYIRFGKRIYTPKYGMWLNMDMIGFSGGSPNWYQYVKNNPVNLVDPTGLSTVACSGANKDLCAATCKKLKLSMMSCTENCTNIPCIGRICVPGSCTCALDCNPDNLYNGCQSSGNKYGGISYNNTRECAEAGCYACNDCKNDFGSFLGCIAADICISIIANKYYGED